MPVPWMLVKSNAGYWMLMLGQMGHFLDRSLMRAQTIVFVAGFTTCPPSGERVGVMRKREIENKTMSVPLLDHHVQAGT